MYNKSQLSKDQKHAKQPRKLPKPTDIDYVSKMGYRDDSPFNTRPYIDINTPTGVIDMTHTSMPLYANGVYLPPNSGMHQFDTTKVREVPVAEEEYAYLTDDEIAAYRDGGYVVEEMDTYKDGGTDIHFSPKHNPANSFTVTDPRSMGTGGNYVQDQITHFQDGGNLNKRILKRYPGMQKVYGAEGENLNIIKDKNFLPSSSGIPYGDIEFMHPGTDKVNYFAEDPVNDYIYQNPTPDIYTAVYNPKGANKHDVFLDMMHGMRDDPEYMELLDQFSTEAKKARGTSMDKWYNYDVENENYEDGRETWDNNYIDSLLRAHLAKKGMGKRSFGKKDYKMERKFSSPEMYSAADKIYKYLKGKQDGGNTDPGNNALELHMFYDKDIYKKQDGGSFIYKELTDDEIAQYRRGGYIVEDISVPSLNRFAEGGNKKKKKEEEVVEDTQYEYYKRKDDPTRAYLKDSQGNYFNYSQGYVLPIEEGYDIEKDLVPNLVPMSSEEKQLVQTNIKELPDVEVKGEEMPFIQRVARKVYRALSPGERKRVAEQYNNFATEEDFIKYDRENVTDYPLDPFSQYQYGKTAEEAKSNYYNSPRFKPQAAQAADWLWQAGVLGGAGVGTGAAGDLAYGIGKVLNYSPVSSAPWLNLGKALEADMAYQTFKDEGYVDQAADAFSEGNYKEGIAKAAMAGLGSVGPLKLISELGQTSKVSDLFEGAGEFLTTQTPLKNTYKINPLRFKADPNAAYRMIGNEAGFQDALATGMLRPNPQGKYSSTFYNVGTPLERYGNMQSSGQGVQYIAEVPLENKSLVERFAGDPYRVSKAEQHVSINDPNVTLYKQNWLRGYKPVNTSSQTENITRAGSGSMDMSRYEIKNPDYYTQLLNTYDSRKLSQSNKKFYSDLINSIKNQNGIATERQYNELQRLKTGNFNFGTKGYQSGGSYYEDELTDAQIEALRSQGIRVEEL